MEPRKLHQDPTKESSMKTLQAYLMDYSWGSSLVIDGDLLKKPTDQLLNNLNPLIKRNNLGIFLVFEDTLHITNTGGKTLYDVDLYNKILEYGNVAAQSVPFIFQMYEIYKDNSEDEDGVFIIYDTANPELNYGNEIQERLQGTIDDLMTSSEKDTSKTSIVKIRLYMRLYPQSASILFPTRQIKSEILSNNEILQTSSKKTNMRIILKNNLATNTLDTQWLDLYHTFFDYWMDNGNRKFQVIAGEYILNNCYIERSPVLPQTFNPLAFFNLHIVSAISDSKLIKG